MIWKMDLSGSFLRYIGRIKLVFPANAAKLKGVHRRGTGFPCDNLN